MSVRGFCTPFGFTFADEDSVKLITSFLLSYPLAGLLKRIPDSKPLYKNLFIVGYVTTLVFFKNF